MQMILGAIAAGMTVAGVILLIGLTAAAVVAIVLSVVAIAWGGVDYVRRHG